jgi:hypothetical protein
VNHGPGTDPVAPHAPGGVVPRVQLASTRIVPLPAAATGLANRAGQGAAVLPVYRPQFAAVSGNGKQPTVSPVVPPTRPTQSPRAPERTLVGEPSIGSTIPTHIPLAPAPTTPQRPLPNGREGSPVEGNGKLPPYQAGPPGSTHILGNPASTGLADNNAGYRRAPVAASAPATSRALAGAVAPGSTPSSAATQGPGSAASGPVIVRPRPSNPSSSVVTPAPSQDPISSRPAGPRRVYPDPTLVTGERGASVPSTPNSAATAPARVAPTAPVYSGNPSRFIDNRTLSGGGNATIGGSGSSGTAPSSSYSAPTATARNFSAPSPAPSLPASTASSAPAYNGPPTRSYTPPANNTGGGTANTRSGNSGGSGGGNNNSNNGRRQN